MSTGSSSEIASGTQGTQGNFTQLNSKIASKNNADRVEKSLVDPTDFFVGPNGKALPAKYKNWIGTNQRNVILDKADDNRLRTAIKELYREGSFIGDGGTADAIRFEKATGLGIGRGGTTHLQKGREMVRHLEKKILRNRNLSASDRILAQQLVDDLKKAIGGYR
ncbi:MAG: hypothetical protein II969_05385 [Anaerolineaceae bacterium]|nr:hypothetical protein [Anaerolineaceae bacterium]